MGFLLVVAIFVGGCGGSERYPQLPAKLDQDSLLKQTVGMTAER